MSVDDVFPLTELQNWLDTRDWSADQLIAIIDLYEVLSGYLMEKHHDAITARWRELDQQKYQPTEVQYELPFDDSLDSII